MITFTKEVITEHIDRIRGAGDVCMYYVHGNEKGALIDTGYGIGDLKGYIDAVYRQPYDVIITHGHADHANGIAQWDSVYMNVIDKDLYYERSSVSLRKEMLKKKYPDIESWSGSEFQPVFKGVFLQLEDGMTFALGGVSHDSCARSYTGDDGSAYQGRSYSYFRRCMRCIYIPFQTGMFNCRCISKDSLQIKIL